MLVFVIKGKKMNLKPHPINNKYMISECGRIFRDGVEVHQTKTSEGYKTFYLSEQKKSELVHRAVIKAHVKNIPSDIPVNHINGIKNDNNLSNLELSSIADNNKHSRYVLGNSSGKYLRILDDITILTAVTCRIKYTHKEIANILNINQNTLRSAISGNNYMSLREIIKEDMSGAIKYSLIKGKKISKSGKKSKYGMGVKKDGNKFYAKVNYLKKTINIGSFNTPEEAHNAYLFYKNNYCI